MIDGGLDRSEADFDTKLVHQFAYIHKAVLAECDKAALCCLTPLVEKKRAVAHLMPTARDIQIGFRLQQATP